ncbi:MerR family transcriptional regulator [Streptomyces sp. ODS28]|uniref:MerR family transcriptional regulator n=1 Tax=Streptomyces sp. ODS28 TaxID=3136688 RepID=UPI0031EF0F15
MRAPDEHGDEDGEEPGPGLSTGAVARRLGVSPTTLRSWDRRYGLGPAAREHGRHRRWTPGDLAVLEEMCRRTALGVPPAEAARAARASAGRPVLTAADAPAVTVPRQDSRGRAVPATVREEARGLGRAALRLDATALDGLLTGLMSEHGLVPCWEEVLVPTLRAVGRRWERAGEPYVAVEHLLSWHISTALRSALPGPGARHTAPAVLACVPDEWHTLPLEALAVGMAQRGLPTRMLGGAVPVEALEEAVRRTGPAVVVLWSQSRATSGTGLAHRLGALDTGVRGARTRPRIVQAGPGWAGRPRGTARRPHGLREALDLLTGLCSR